MEEPKEDIWKTEELDDIKDRVYEYVNVRLRLWKLSVIESISKAIGAIILAIVLFCVLLTGLIFATAALAIVIGNALHSLALGSLIVSAVYILLAWLVYANRRGWVLDPLVRLVSDIIDPSDENENENYKS